MEQLGVADLVQGLAEARQLWQDWVEQDPRLASAPAVDGLQDWLMLVGIDAADEVLHVPPPRKLPDLQPQVTGDQGEETACPSPLMR
jgi:hypothetical protein